jgi:hypothetical protein
MRLVMTRAALATVLLGLPALAGPVGYAQATGYYKKDTRPTLYQPLNLLDGRDATAWCTTGSDPLNDTLVFGFKGSARIEEVRITTGNNFDGNTFKEFARAHKFELKGLRDGRKFTVADQRGVQAVPLSPPLEASRVTLEVLDVYPSDDPEASVCITDVVFISDGKPLNGPWMAPKLKYDKSMQPLLGTWFAGYEGAPDRFLNLRRHLPLLVRAVRPGPRQAQRIDRHLRRHAHPPDPRDSRQGEGEPQGEPGQGEGRQGLHADDGRRSSSRAEGRFSQQALRSVFSLQSAPV